MHDPVQGDTCFTNLQYKTNPSNPNQYQQDVDMNEPIQYNSGRSLQANSNEEKAAKPNNLGKIKE